MLNSKRQRTRPVAALFLWQIVLAEPANAQLAPPFPELIRQAEVSSPQLDEMKAKMNAAEGRARQAAAWPNPTIGIELEDFAGGGAYHGTSRSQTTIALSEPLELGGQRGARIAVGRAELNTAETRLSQARADFGYALAVAYASAEAAQRRLELLTEDTDLAQEDLRSARALVDAGREGELRAMQAEAAAATATAELESARAEALVAFTQLSTVVGTTDVYTGVAGSLLSHAGQRRAVAAPSQPASMPAVAVAQAERQAAEKQLAAERKRAIPTPSISIGARRIAGDDANVWVAGLSLPLPLFDRNTGAIAAARADLNAAEARLNLATLSGAAEWRAAIAQSDAASSRLEAAAKAESSASEAYRLTRIGYEAGRAPLFELLGTRHALTDARLRSIDARLARVRAEATLARLAGRLPFIE